MKSLLLKDLFTLTRQLRLFLLILLLFALIPGIDLAAFAVVYAAFLPMSAIAYDEHTKWDQLAVMMPYTSFQLVASKYLLGFGFSLIAAVLSFGLRFAYTAITGAEIDLGALLAIPVSIVAALFLQAIALPAIFRLGVEKGRFIFLVIVILVISMLGFVPEQGLHRALPAIPLLIGLTLLILLVCTVLSIRLSIRFYEQKVMR